jgi:hypothetical protein
MLTHSMPLTRNSWTDHPCADTVLCCAAVDALFGTLPRSGSSVPLTDMARMAHGAASKAAPKQKSSDSRGAAAAGAQLAALSSSNAGPAAVCSNRVAASSR